MTARYAVHYSSDYGASMLARNTASLTGHRPRFTSSLHGRAATTTPLLLPQRKLGRNDYYGLLFTALIAFDAARCRDEY